MQTDSPKNSASSCLFILLFPAVLGIAGFVFFKLRADNQALRAKADAELFAPYFAMIKDGKYEAAYRSYTNDSYQKLYSLEAYQKHYAEVIAK